jgi:hypothetical protein
MTLLARSIKPVAAIACFIAASMMAGCSDRESEMAASQARVWIPDAATRAFPLGVGVNLAYIQGASRKREAITVIDEPSTRQGSFFFWWSRNRPSVDQAVLAKSTDGRFYVAHYVWRLDPILEGCVDTPSLCSRFTEIRTLSEEEAKVVLRRSAQFTPALYRDLFGSLPAGANA